jgi:hypothetical protein
VCLHGGGGCGWFGLGVGQVWADCKLTWENPTTMHCPQPGHNHLSKAKQLVCAFMLAVRAALSDKCAMGGLLLCISASDLSADSASMLT